MGAKVFDLREGDALLIGSTLITVRPKTGRRTKLAVEAPNGVAIQRIDQIPSACTVVAGEGVANIKSTP